MGKATGFLEYGRDENGLLPVRERIRNFREFHCMLGEKERRAQGARCMNCGVPLCQSAMRLSGMVTGCPLHNLIPEWNHEVYLGQDRLALERLLKTNSFPEFTGRVCPALCEKACICGMNDQPVTVHENELFIIERAYAAGYMQPRRSPAESGKKVAVVGSGPSGLAVADMLCRRGHAVTVFERDDRIGGLLMYGIPNMKLEKQVIARRQALMEAEGVVFRTGVDVGRDIPAEEILRVYDAVALCTGAKKPRALQAEGLEACTSGVRYAVDFLSQVTREVLGDAAADSSAADILSGSGDNASSGEGTGCASAAEQVRGKHVVIVGGGDTGNDCAGSVIRLGAASVTQLEMMPEPPEERREDNPWPEWPKVKKTDYGQQEAIDLFGRDPRVYETTVKQVLHESGRLSGLVTSGVRFADGRLSLVGGTEREIPCDLLLVAAGFTGCEPYTAEAFSVGLTDRGCAETEQGGHYTGREKVFAAGDMRRGQSLVVWAIAEGRDCAAEIDRYLMGYSNME